MAQSLLRNLLSSRKSALIFSPGQQGLVLRRMEIWHAIANLCLAALVRSRGGVVAKVARSVEGDSRIMLQLERGLKSISSLYSVRDRRSAQLVGCRLGQVVPDIAVTVRPSSRVRDRGLLVMSWRHDRAIPRRLIEECLERAPRYDLVPILVTQVWKDSERHQELAETYGIEHLDWLDKDHLRQYSLLTELYAGSRYVLSNRLHALILGWNSGAVPIGFSSDSDTKISCHLDECGLRDLVIRENDSPRRVDDFLGDYPTWLKTSLDAHALASQRVEHMKARLIEGFLCQG